MRDYNAWLYIVAPTASRGALATRIHELTGGASTDSPDFFSRPLITTIGGLTTHYIASPREDAALLDALDAEALLWPGCSWTIARTDQQPTKADIIFWLAGLGLEFANPLI